jgi:L-ascorbate metabolism protein UlaG (beta-lactamase superfamily)
MKAKILLAACLALIGLSLTARAAEPEACPRLVAEGAPRFLRAAATQDMARLTFQGHATFLIETRQGVRAATDYNDYVRVPLPLDAVTMNKAHSTHFTSHPDPHIGQVLRGWNPAGGEMLHDVRIGDLRIRNVQTNIRDWSGGTDYLGNSIFVFETGQMCIAHLGHLHHELTAEHLRQLGQIDVLLVPVDGSYTLDQTGMMDVIEKIGPRIVVPMHFFGSATLERFLRLAGERFELERRDKPKLVVVKDELPVKTRVIVLPGH